MSTSPAAPEQIVAEVAALDAADVDRAIVYARAHADEWASSAVDRSAALHEWAGRIESDRDSLAMLITREVGKTIRESRAEVRRSVAILRYYAQAAFDEVGELFPGANSSTQVTVRRLPVGVVAAICPWNFPLAIPVWKLAPALAYGNAVLFKPSSEAVGVGQRLVELSRPNVPPEVLHFVPVRSSHVRMLVEDRRIDAISFTGSTEVGHSLIPLAAQRGARIQAEMGGQNASIVLPDADVEAAAATITDAAMGYAGQKCTATSRILVVGDVHDAFMERLVSRVESIAVGDPSEEATDMGPVINADAKRTVEGSVEEAARRGAEVLISSRDVPSAGWFVPATLLGVTEHRDDFLMHETFGPAAAVVRVATVDEAVALANSTRYGLAAAVFGSDPSVTDEVARQLRAGMVRVNGSTTGADYWVPFGGEKDSSYGPREQGREARQFFTRSQTVSITRL